MHQTFFSQTGIVLYVFFLLKKEKKMCILKFVISSFVVFICRYKTNLNLSMLQIKIVTLEANLVCPTGI